MKPDRLVTWLENCEPDRLAEIADRLAVDAGTDTQRVAAILTLRERVSRRVEIESDVRFWAPSQVPCWVDCGRQVERFPSLDEYDATSAFGCWR